MALPRFATLTAAETIGRDTRVLTLELRGDEPLGFSGGQYLIIDTGLTAASGKAVKRAYSILSGDVEQRRFTLASKRLPGGPGSGYLHELPVGAEIKFSGPWGKMRPAELDGRTLVLATDTGVTAALGLVRGQRWAPLLPRTRLIWLRPDAAYFLPEAFVRERLPAGLGAVEIGTLPPIGHPERVAHVRALLSDDLAPGRPPPGGRPPLAQAFIAGDGIINYALLDDLNATGVPATRDHLESFFNMPKKAEAA
jgi:ferredoxin-NADP reductase